MKKVANPYRKPHKLKDNELLQQQTQILLSATAHAEEMGIQSQLRNGSIKSCKKRATKVKHNKKSNTKATYFNGKPFVPKVHCKVCKAKHNNKRVPHVKHHNLCYNSRNYKKKNSNNTTISDKFFKQCLRNNNALYIEGRDKIDYSKEERKIDAAKYFTPTMASTIYQPPDPSKKPTGIKFTNASYKTESTVDHRKKDAAEFRKELDKLVKLYKDGEKEYEWVKESKFPAEIALAAHIISVDVRHRKPLSTSQELPDSEKFKEGLEVFQHYFKPGSCTHTFSSRTSSSEDGPPSPSYHSITGESIIYLDWKLIAPEEKLHCHNCACGNVHSELMHEKTNFSHNKKLFPLWTGSGRATPVILMNYKCELCNSRYKANDGELLAILPAHIRSMYPVKPVYASGQFHLTTDLAEDLAENMMTYANADVVSKRMYKKMGKSYLSSLETYLSQRPTADYLTVDDYLNHQFPPSGKRLKEAYDAASTSQLTNYRYSRDERSVREIQSVNISKTDKAAVDWTFAVAKNYYGMLTLGCSFSG